VVLLGDGDMVQVAEQLAAGEMHAHLAAGGAGGVQYDGAVAAHIFRLEVQHVDQELGEFVDACRQFCRCSLANGILGEQRRVVVLHHTGAGAGGHHNRPVIGE